MVGFNGTMYLTRLLCGCEYTLNHYSQHSLFSIPLAPPAAPFCLSSSSRPGSGDHRRPVAPRLPFFTQGTAEVDTTVFGTVLQVRCCCAVLLFIVLIRVQNGKPIEAKIHFTAGDLVLNRSLTRPAHGYFTWMLSCSRARFCTHEASQCWSTRTGR